MSDGSAPPPDTVDAPIGCEADPDSCPAMTPICTGGICVECTPNNLDQCTASEPFCGLDNRCRGCISHDDCQDTSAVCLADGTCAAISAVAYVAQGGTPGACTQASPCGRVQDALATAASIFKVTGTVTDTMSVNINRSVDIYGAPGAAITRDNNGDIISINNNASVRFFGIIIKDGASLTGNGIHVNSGSLLVDASLIANNDGLGIDARNVTSVTLRRSILFNNGEGGAQLDNTPFSITNCLIVENGSAGSSVGGLKIKPVTGTMNTLELVTLASNLSVNSDKSAVRCDQPFVGHSNIVTGNTLDSNCAFDHSLFDTMVPGTGNRVGLPKFLSTLDPTALDFYRIADDSAAIDGAVSTIPFDIDGQARPVGAGPDMGADERP